MWKLLCYKICLPGKGTTEQLRLSSLHTGRRRRPADWAQVHGPVSSWWIRFGPRLIGRWSGTETGTVPRPKAAVTTVGCQGRFPTICSQRIDWPRRAGAQLWITGIGGVFVWVCYAERTDRSLPVLPRSLPPQRETRCRGTTIHNPPGAGQATKHSTAGMWTPRVPPCRAASSLSRQEGLSPRCHCRGRRMQRRRESMRGRRQFRRLAAAERRPGTLPCQFRFDHRIHLTRNG